jgi:sporulation protein YlmC with PRC-barrel domain
MKITILAGSVSALTFLGFGTPLLAAPPTATGMSQPSSAEKTGIAMKAAQRCLSDLLAFDSQMEKEGYWLSGSGYGYGYPINAFYNPGGSPIISNRLEANRTNYQTARPGYEVRMLFAAANILAQHGQQQECEDVLATTRDVYKLYVADMHNLGAGMVGTLAWRRQQIAAAEPVTTKNIPFRSDELLGTDVRDPQNEALGSIEDLVMNPQTGKIAYLAIASGGIFGIGEKYVLVPWEDFKISPNVNMLVLDTSKSVLAAAPQLNKRQFTTGGQFDQESQRADAYWKTHFPEKATNGSRN